MRFATLFAAALILAGSSLASADTIDEAEAKRRGVTVQQVQLEQTQQQLKSLSDRMASMERQVAAIRAEIAKLVQSATQPAPIPTPAQQVTADPPSRYIPRTEDAIGGRFSGGNNRIIPGPSR